MKDLIEKAAAKKGDSAEEMAKRVEEELKKAGVKRVTRNIDEVYVSAGENEAWMTFNTRENKAGVRVAVFEEVDASGKAIAAFLKKHGVK